MALYNLTGRRRHHDVIDAVPPLAEKMRVHVFLIQFLRLYQSFRQSFD